MPKTIVLGTDLHGEATEPAAKLVNNIKKNLKNYKIVSIEHRKKFTRQRDLKIIPKLFSNSRLRRLTQAILLPIYLTIFRTAGYNKISTFWVANGNYHKILFSFLNLIGFKIFFTIISGKETNFEVLKKCEAVICQSERMNRFARSKLNNRVFLIAPGVNLDIFKPGKKENTLLIPSVPYNVKDFDERGINDILKVIDELKINSIIISRSDESYEYVKNKKIKNLKLINMALNDIELGKIMSKSRIIPLFYSSKSPDVPLSAIEGLASGCALVCTDKIGISEVIAKEKCGVVVKSKKELMSAITSTLKNKNYSEKSRRLASKYFDIEKCVKSYVKLIS